MKDLGIIGTGKNAATWYLKKCQELYQTEYGNDAEFPVKLISIPFDPINAILPDQMEKAGRLMLPHLQKMDKLAVSRFILANITLHEAIELQSKNIQLNSLFISLKTVIANHWDSNINKAMILGSYYTMQSEYLPRLFEAFDIEFLKPSEKDFTSIDQLRTTYFNSPNPKASKNVFNELKRNYPEVDSFIIACTEHALALNDYKNPFNSFNLPELQCVELLRSKSD